MLWPWGVSIKPVSEILTGDQERGVLLVLKHLRLLAAGPDHQQQEGFMEVKVREEVSALNETFR